MALGGQVIDFAEMYLRPQESMRNREDAYLRSNFDEIMIVDDLRYRIEQSSLAKPEIVASDTPFAEVRLKVLALSGVDSPKVRRSEYTFEDFAADIKTITPTTKGQAAGVPRRDHQPEEIIDDEWLEDIKFVMEQAIKAREQYSWSSRERTSA